MDQAAFEKARLEYLKKGEKGSKDGWWSAKPGVYLVRLGPPWNSRGDFYKERLQHGDFKADLQVECAENDIDPATGKIRRCVVCTANRELKGKKDDYSKALNKLIWQKTKVIWNVLVALKAIKNPKHPTEAQVVEVEKKFRMWELSPKWQALLMTEFGGDGSGEYWKFTDKHGNEQDNPLSLTHPIYGRWIRAKLTGEKLDKNWSFDVVTGPCPIVADRAELRAIGETLHDLDAQVTGASDEELAGFLTACKKKAKKQADGGGDDDDTESSKKRSAGPVSAKQLFDDLGGADVEADDPF